MPYFANDDIRSVITCPVCFEVYDCPKVLPQCGHTFCMECLDGIKTAKWNCKFSKLRVSFECPECRSKSVVDTLSDLKPNTAVQRVVDQIQMYRTQSKQFCTDTSFCVHVKLNPEFGTICRHCSISFCQGCMFRHVEEIRLQTTCIGSSFRGRLEEISKELEENIEKLNGVIDREVSKTEQEIEAEMELMKSTFLEQWQECKQRLMSTTRSAAQARRLDIEKVTKTATDELLNSEILTRLESINKTSILYCKQEEIEQLHADVLDRDTAIRSLEQLCADGLLLGSIIKMSLCTKPDFQNIVEDCFSCDNIKVEIGKFRYESDCMGKDPWIENKIHVAALFYTGVENFETLMKNLPEQAKRYLLEYRSSTLDRSPLMVAAMYGNLRVVTFLVEQGVDIYSKDGSGSMAIHLAARYGHRDIVAYLANRDPDMLDATENEGNTPMDLAVQSKDKTMIDFIHLFRNPGILMSQSPLCENYERTISRPFSKSCYLY